MPKTRASWIVPGLVAPVVALASAILLAPHLAEDSIAAAALADELGRIDFPTSGAPAAQPAFLRGAMLLHSFEYDDAREAFQEAERLDSDFAMAYWGEAMTFNHPLWRQQDRDAALAALAKLAPTPAARQAKAPTDREKGFLIAVDALYGEGDKRARDAAYCDAMGRLKDRFPGDLEAAAFYALSILGTADGQRDYGTYMRAAAVAEEIYRVNPEHPGALHYLIHAYDDPVHAPLGERAARVYARVAPAAAHAQHMISHIYVALGRWDETVEANEKSVAVSEERARRKGLPPAARTHHALHWLEYGYLQQGRYAAGRRALETMGEDARSRGNDEDLTYHALMRAAWIVETGRWKELPPSAGTGAANGKQTVNAGAVAADRFATGLAALRSGDLESAGKMVNEMRESAGKQAGKPGCEGMPSGPGDPPRAGQVAAILQQELEGMLRASQGRPEEGLALLRAAAAAEDALVYDYGPPDVVKPTHEALGEALLAARRPAEAGAEFQRSLDHAPRRALSLLGLARSAARSGDPDAARRAYATLASIWHGADPDLPALAETRAGGV